MSRRYIDAINAGLRAAMSADKRVVVIGEDVSYGGPFGATKGLVDDFERDRVRDTPISEATIMGMAVGAALTGLRPIVEIMFMDFLTLAMDQLVNHAAKLHFMSGGQLRVPLTVRVQGGIGGLMGAQHSQSLEAWFTHVPGLKVVAPAFPSDMKALLEVAVADDDPVLVLEHRGLYWDRSTAPAGPDRGAVVRRDGTDVTVVAWSKTVHAALAAADQLANEGISLEVVDLRWLSPLDIDTLVASGARTGAVLVAHEAVVPSGFGAEIGALLSGRLFQKLRVPVRRLGGPFAPVGASPELEAAFMVDTADIVSAVREMIGSAERSPVGT